MKKIKTVLMVRKIRDRQNKDIENKSLQDVINYFRKKANGINKKAEKYEVNHH